MSYYPILLDLEKRSALVIGGGAVAERKVRAILDCGGQATVLSPVLVSGLSDLASSGAITWWERDYVEGDLEGFSLAIAATDSPTVNSQVATEACRRGILVNVVDNMTASNFIVPAFFKEDGLIVAVSTSGESPALASKLKDRLHAEIGPLWGEMARLIGEVRCELKDRGISPASLDWEQAVDPDRLLALLSRGMRDEARHALLRGLVGA